jgi:hypothetical protein
MTSFSPDDQILKLQRVCPNFILLLLFFIAELGGGTLPYDLILDQHNWNTLLNSVIKLQSLSFVSPHSETFP